MSGDFRAWVDGIESGTLPVDDRGLQYGDGLFETILVRARTARFLDAHLARLTRGLARLGIKFADADALLHEIARATSLAPALAVLKIIVTRGSGPRGYSPSGCVLPRRIVMLFDSPASPDPGAGVDLRIATIRAACQPTLAGLKHLNRLESVLAAMEPEHAAHFDSLLLGPAGQLVGGTMTNVFVVHEGRVSTPPASEGGVAGVMRSVVLRECEALGFPATERRLTLTDLGAADEVFVTNARVGVVPARRVGEHAFRMHDTALRLRHHIEALDA